MQDNCAGSLEASSIMARYGKRSMSRLDGVHPLLVDWSLRLVSVFDNSVISGVRDLTTQREYVALGVSKTMNSKHLIQPGGYGEALDLAPYPVDWSDTRRFDLLAGYGLMLAHEMGIPIRWGGDWDRDTQVKDQTFHDLGHFEVYTP